MGFMVQYRAERCCTACQAIEDNLVFPPTYTPTFSGHETFVLRSTWLKKGYDTIRQYPDLFVQPEEVSQVKIFLSPGSQTANCA